MVQFAYKSALFNKRTISETSIHIMNNGGKISFHVQRTAYEDDEDLVTI